MSVTSRAPTPPEIAREPGTANQDSGAERRRRLGRLVPPALAFIVVVLSWQLFVLLELGQIPMPGPVDVLISIVTFGTSAEFWGAAAQSARVLVQGLVPGVALGILSGVVIGNVRWLKAGFGPLLFAIYTTPFIALIPLLLVLFGFGVLGKTSIVFFLVWITVVLQTLAGVDNVDETYLEVASSFRTPWARRWFQISLPAALPFVIAGVRLGIGRALVGVVVAEFETAITGLGGIILLKAQSLELDDAIVPAIFLAAVGISATAGLRSWEKRLQVWKE